MANHVPGYSNGQLVHLVIIPHPAAGDLLRLVLIQECLRWNPPFPFPPPMLGDREAEKEADIWGFLLGVEEEEEEEAAGAPEAVSSVSMSSRSSSSLNC